VPQGFSETGFYDYCLEKESVEKVTNQRPQIELIQNEVYFISSFI